MNRLCNRRPACFLAITAVLCSAMAAAAEPYDPLAVGDRAPGPFDVTLDDASRKREIPLRIYLPPSPSAAPVILFSHGLGGSRENNPYLGRHWSARGYAVVFVQHRGSDELVWRGQPVAGRMAALRQAAGLQNFMLRAADIPAVLDQLGKWNAEQGHRLVGRLDMEHVGMSGHSFGAHTTQAVAGQRFGRLAPSLTDKRIKAAIAMSPSVPQRGDPAEAFSEVAIAWLLMTGTHDTSPIGQATVESRLAVFPALPPGDKYQLVLDGAEHSAFSERALPNDRRRRNPNHHRAILALSTAFWDAYLRHDPAAKAWLSSNAPRSVLEENDRWERK